MKYKINRTVIDSIFENSNVAKISGRYLEIRLIDCPRNV